LTATELREWQFNDAIDRVVNVVSTLYQTNYANGEGESSHGFSSHTFPPPSP